MIFEELSPLGFEGKHERGSSDPSTPWLALIDVSTSVADTVTGVESLASSASAQSFVVTAMTAAAAASSSMMILASCGGREDGNGLYAQKLSIDRGGFPRR